MTRPTPDRNRRRIAKKEALREAKMRGCTCEPDIHIVKDEGRGTIMEVDVSHDNTCIFLQRRRATFN